MCFSEKAVCGDTRRHTHLHEERRQEHAKGVARFTRGQVKRRRELLPFRGELVAGRMCTETTAAKRNLVVFGVMFSSFRRHFQPPFSYQSLLSPELPPTYTYDSTAVAMHGAYTWESGGTTHQRARGLFSAMPLIFTSSFGGLHPDNLVRTSLAEYFYHCSQFNAHPQSSPWSLHKLQQLWRR